jgi:hypothetical protein
MTGFKVPHEFVKINLPVQPMKIASIRTLPGAKGSQEVFQKAIAYD